MFGVDETRPNENWRFVKAWDFDIINRNFLPYTAVATVIMPFLQTVITFLAVSNTPTVGWLTQFVNTLKIQSLFRFSLKS